MAPNLTSYRTFTACNSCQPKNKALLSFRLHADHSRDRCHENKEKTILHHREIVLQLGVSWSYVLQQHARTHAHTHIQAWRTWRRKRKCRKHFANEDGLNENFGIEPCKNTRPACNYVSVLGAAIFKFVFFPTKLQHV